MEGREEKEEGRRGWGDKVRGEESKNLGVSILGGASVVSNIPFYKGSNTLHKSLLLWPWLALTTFKIFCPQILSHIFNLLMNGGVVEVKFKPQ